MTPRELAGCAARIAAYGSATVRTPADYTLLEAIDAMCRDVGYAKAPKRRRYERVEIAQDEALGPMFGEMTE